MDVNWSVLEEEYSECGITRTADNLIAISSLARTFADEVFEHDVYLAGLWKSQLIMTLPWKVYCGMLSSGPPPSRYSEYVAPS
jgi:hypothetical protein